MKNQRDDYQHIISKELVESQDQIFAEDLKVKNLVKNHNLAYAITDVAWGDFLRKIEYKAIRYDKGFLKVNPKNTTQTCPCCGYINESENKLKLSQREWDCPQCGEHHIRDIAAAINILNKGMEALKLS